MTSSALVASFAKYFRVVLANSPALQDEVFRVRFKVYCMEMRTEPQERFLDGREYDAFDEFAAHCLLQHRSSGLYAGCVRLVYSDPVKSPLLPVEAFCGDSLFPHIASAVLPNRGSYGEISRLAVPAEFRRRSGEQNTAIPMTLDVGEAPHSGDRRERSLITMGLFLAATALGLIRGLDGVFAMMEPRLARYLKQFGLEFAQVGNVVEYHGQRAAHYITKDGLKLHGDVAALLDHIAAEINQQL